MFHQPTPLCDERKKGEIHQQLNLSRLLRHSPTISFQFSPFENCWNLSKSQCRSSSNFLRRFLSLKNEKSKWFELKNCSTFVRLLLCPCTWVSHCLFLRPSRTFKFHKKRATWRSELLDCSNQSFFAKEISRQWHRAHCSLLENWIESLKTFLKTCTRY